MIELLFTVIFVTISSLLTVVSFLFLCWMLVDCITREPSPGYDRLIWVLVILFAPVVGPLLYYLVRRPERIQTYGR